MRTDLRFVMLAVVLVACSEDPALKERCTDDSCDKTEDDSKTPPDADDDNDDDDDDSDDSKDAGRGKDSGASVLDAKAEPPAKSDAQAAPDATNSSDAAPPAPGEGSSGCGATSVAPAGNGTITIDGTERQYIVALPDNYDANKKYKLIYAWHGLGGTAMSIARSWYGLQRASMGSAIFVAGQGLDAGGGGAGWPNTGGRDVAFVKALHERMLANYCVDQDRVFSVGMSYGGIMSNTLGCQMGDVFRAIAPMSGSGPLTRGTTCKGQVAAWMSHGTQDTTVPFASGEASRDHWLEANHCQQTSAPTDPSPCVAYQGCDDGHPVHWCQFDGGHTIPQFASAAIWKFLAQF